MLKMISVKKIVVGILNTNCYIIEKDKECLIIDPGDNFNKINSFVNKKVIGVLLTHTHFDHVGAMEDCIKNYNTQVYSFDNLKEGINSIGNIEFSVKYNPGHTLDSISFIFDDIMFSGDFIFKDCIGRCDIGGDFNLMKDSIKEILESDINYLIYPGHGDSTTLNDEINMLKSYVK